MPAGIRRTAPFDRHPGRPPDFVGCGEPKQEAASTLPFVFRDERRRLRAGRSARAVCEPPRSAADRQIHVDIGEKIG